MVMPAALYPSPSIEQSMDKSSQELAANLEVLQAYWNHCTAKVSADNMRDGSELEVYLFLIVELLQDGKFISKTESDQYTHVLFEAAIKLDIFRLMFEWHTIFHGTDLEKLKCIYIQFYDELISSDCLPFYLREEFLLPMMMSLGICSIRSSFRVENMLLQTLHTICVSLHRQIHSGPKSLQNCFLGSKPNDLFWSVCLNPSMHASRSNKLPLNKSRKVSSSFSTLDDHNEQISFNCLSPSNSPSVVKTPDSCLPLYPDGPFTSAPALPFLIERLCSDVASPKIDSLCDLLVPYVCRDGSLSWLSRDALLLLASSSIADADSSYQMAKRSNLCEGLTIEMVLLYNNLPRCMTSTNQPDQWPVLLNGLNISSNKGGALFNFLDHFSFCCSILDVSNVQLKEAMLTSIQQGFLLPVLAPALLQTTAQEVATATMYLDFFLRHSAGNALLPFLLRFLLLEHSASSPESWNCSGEKLREGLGHALEHSFPGYPVSAFSNNVCSEQSSTADHYPRSYMDVFLQRLHCCNSLVGIATLSLINTIFSFLCEDVTFELILKYLVPYGESLALSDLVSDSNTLILSANQFMSLIPPYCSSQSVSNSELNTEGRQNGIGVSPSVEAATSSSVNIKPTVTKPVLGSSYLLEAHRLVNECIIACSFWSFPYDCMSPTANQVSGARICEKIVLLQSSHNKPSSDTNAADDPFSADHQWELDEEIQKVGANTRNRKISRFVDSSLILADLEKFSDMLRQPSSFEVSTSSDKVGSHLLNKNSLPSQVNKSDARVSNPRSIFISDEVKRTSSFYDISFMDSDLGAVEEISNTVCVTAQASNTKSVFHPRPNTLALNTDISQSDENETSSFDLDSFLVNASNIAERYNKANFDMERLEIVEQFINIVKKYHIDSISSPISHESVAKEMIKWRDGVSTKKSPSCCSEITSVVSKDQVIARNSRSSSSEQAHNSKNASTNCRHSVDGNNSTFLPRGGSDSGIVSLDIHFTNQSWRGMVPNSQLPSPAGRSTSFSSNSKYNSAKKDSDQVNPGPFLTVILQLLARLPENHFFVSLLVTSIISKLVALPLPLLRSFLLSVKTNQDGTMSHSARNESLSSSSISEFRNVPNSEYFLNPKYNSLQLYPILCNIRQWFDCYVNLHFPGESRLMNALKITTPDSPRKRSIFTRWRSTSAQKPQPAPYPDLYPTPDIGGHLGVSSQASRIYENFTDEKSRNVILSCLIFHEFCQELSAICLEHSASL